MKKLLLTEIYQFEAVNAPDELERFILKNLKAALSQEHGANLAKQHINQYRNFLEKLSSDDIADQKKFFNDPTVMPFYKALLKRAKKENIDASKFPTMQKMNGMVSDIISPHEPETFGPYTKTKLASKTPTHIPTGGNTNLGMSYFDYTAS